MLSTDATPVIMLSGNKQRSDPLAQLFQHIDDTYAVPIRYLPNPFDERTVFVKAYLLPHDDPCSEDIIDSYMHLYTHSSNYSNLLQFWGESFETQSNVIIKLPYEA